MRSYFQSTPGYLYSQVCLLYLYHIIVIGPNVPIISTSTGGFVGGIRTNFGSFDTRSDSKPFINNRDSEEDNQEEENYRPSPYRRNNYNRQRSRPEGKYVC